MTPRADAAQLTFPTPTGSLLLRATEAGLIEATFRAEATDAPADDHPVLRQAATWLEAYLDRRALPTLPRLRPEGTPFQQRVWQALLDIPFGQTQSYAALSQRLGDPKAIRAVAAANGANPLAIFIPCHRVIGSDGSLTGYAGGLERKAWLLRHEGALAAELF